MQKMLNRQNRGRSRLKWRHPATALSLLAFLATPVWGQTDQTTATVQRKVVDAIVVTAQKRAQSLQVVPMSVRALTEDMLLDLGADDFVDYARTIPSLSFVERGPGLNKIVIRGISGNAGVGTAAIYIDDIPITTDFLTPDLKLFDVERVEVLRGPQGTLYGEGSMGGTIKIVTAKPDSTEFGAKFDGTYSNTKGGGSNYAANGMVNIPIVEDKLAVRALGYYRNEDGWLDNVALGQSNVNDEETIGGRISARLDATDNLTITGTVMYQDTETGGEQIASPELGDLKQSRLVKELLNDEFIQANLTITYDFGWAELLSSTSFFDREQPFNRELPGIASLLGVPIAEVTFGFDNQVFAQEVRLTSPDDQRLRWLLGVFYKDRMDEQVNFVTAPPIGEVFRSDAKTEFEQIAVFGDLTFDITDRLEVSAGLRWFKEKLKADSVSTVIFTGFIPEILAEDTENTAVTPRFTLSYDITSDAMIYAIASRGFRSGGVNLNAFPGTPATFEPDTIWNYELGVKTSWFDDRLVFNAGGFYIDWNNMQVVDSIIPGVAFTSNAGAAHSTGFEVEMTAVPVEGLTLTANAGYNNAELDEDVPTEGGFAGDRVPFVPRYTASLSGEYRFPVFNDYFGVVRLDYQTVAKSFNSFAGGLQRAYDLGNIRVGLEGESWSVFAFINNAWDERAELRVIAGEGIYYTEPRTIGINLRANY